MACSLRSSTFQGAQLRAPVVRRAAPVINTRICAGKQLEGKVVSDKMDKTITVLVERYTDIPRYGKRVLRTKKYKVHDENNEAEAGDFVSMTECRKLSKDKYFTLDKILRKVVKL